MPKDIIFTDYPDFRPNITPAEMFKAGVFGGTYWRPIYSSIVGKNFKNAHKEFRYLSGISEEYLSSKECNVKLNKYKVKSGSSLKDWEDKKWIKAQDPYGWVQWYCRFYSGRRSPDDERQIKRWKSFAGENGRFRKRLINMIFKKNTNYNDYSVSPVIRQGLLQWGYELTKKDFKK